MKKATFKCKLCGWEKQLPETWANVTPRFCGNHKCEMSARGGKGKKSFRITPELLEITLDSEKKAAEASKADSHTDEPKVKNKRK